MALCGRVDCILIPSIPRRSNNHVLLASTAMASFSEEELAMGIMLDVLGLHGGRRYGPICQPSMLEQM